MEFRAWFRRILGAAALPQSENHVGQQQCVAFVLRHTIFRKRGFSQINVTTRRRSSAPLAAFSIFFESRAMTLCRLRES